MSRYIDADHLRKWILSWWERTEPTSECLKGRDILNQIDREPSIDIIFCKECMERDDDWCMYWQNVINPDDFCSYGERGGE